LVSNPTEEITIVLADDGTVSEKIPISLVEVPAFVPFTRMVALETGRPEGSTTLPVAVLSWDQEVNPSIMRNERSVTFFRTFFIRKFLLLK
jgi:hypothetical protein